MATITRTRANTGLFTGRYSNTSVTVGTTTTVIITATDFREYNQASIVWYNGNASYDVTAKIWVSNKASPTAIGGTNWEQDWAQLGSDQTISTTSAEAMQWSGQYLWIGATATASTATSTDNDVYLKLSRS